MKEKERNKEFYMAEAIKCAKKGANKGEVPIGAVVVYKDNIIARGYNKRHKSKNSLMHAEVVAITKACKVLGDWRLNECDIYVTLEPCCMCVGLIINSRIQNVYFGAYEKKSGCCGSVVNLFELINMNQTTQVFGGIREAECSAILTEFFANRRKS